MSSSSSSSQMLIEAMASTRSLMRAKAMVYFQGLRKKDQKLIKQRFESTTTGKKDRVSLQQVITALDQDLVDQTDMKSLGKLFQFLDHDRSSSFDFDQFLTLIYILRAYGPGGVVRCCDSCGAAIALFGYTCKACDLGNVGNGKDKFELFERFHLCLACFSFGNFHHHHSRDEFVDDYFTFAANLAITNDQPNLDHKVKKAKEPKKLVQCVVCKEYHNQALGSMLHRDGQHIPQESNACFLCEWCSSWRCNNCGKYFRITSARNSKVDNWLDVSLYCRSCGVQGNNNNLENVFKALENHEDIHKCSTCSEKLQCGSMWGSYTKKQQEVHEEVKKQQEMLEALQVHYQIAAKGRRAAISLLDPPGTKYVYKSIYDDLI